MWLARGTEGELTFHYNKPFRKETEYHSDDLTTYAHWHSDPDYLELPDNLFPEVTFRNSPVEADVLSSIQLKNMLDRAFSNGYYKGRDDERNYDKYRHKIGEYFSWD